MSKILIVDDEERLRKLYSAILEKEQHEVLTAGSAKEGFDLALSSQPDLILLDVVMPSEDGGDAFASLSGNASTRNIPVIFLTSLIREEEVDAAKGKIGGRDYISKSTPMNKFMERVKLALAAAAPKP